MGEDQDQTKNRNQSSEEDGDENQKEEMVLQLLDSTDSYLTLIDSLSSTLRQGWLDLASARHSMGASRVTSTLFDLKLHPAATTLQVTQLEDESSSQDPMRSQPHFTLSKWVSTDDAKGSPKDIGVDEEELHKKSNPQLRRRGAPQVSEIDKESPRSNSSSPTADDQVGKERSKSLSVFGTLVSPKLRASQLSFETALETLVELANMRSLTLSACAHLRSDADGITE